MHTLAEVDDGEAFRDTMDAMAVIGLDEDVRNSALWFYSSSNPWCPWLSFSFAEHADMIVVSGHSLFPL